MVPSSRTIPVFFQPSFSGHETFALRGNWLKKAFDLLGAMPDLFAREDAFVRLGVGKNMAQSIKHWGRAAGVFVRTDTGFAPTPLGAALLDDQGWDPFLVTPAARWLLHFQLAAAPEPAYTWYTVFNVLRAGEFSTAQLAEDIQRAVREMGANTPSNATLRRDIDCLLHTYVRPSAKQIAASAEDALTCPLAELDLIQSIGIADRFRVRRGSQSDLPDALVAYALLAMLRRQQRLTISFGELVFAPGSPGRVFCLDEDGLLERLERIDSMTDGNVSYSDSAGVRQVRWSGTLDDNGLSLLATAFGAEVASG